MDGMTRCVNMITTQLISSPVHKGIVVEITLLKYRGQEQQMNWPQQAQAESKFELAFLNQDINTAKILRSLLINMPRVKMCPTNTTHVRHGKFFIKESSCQIE